MSVVAWDKLRRNMRKRDEIRIELQAILNKFAPQIGLTEGECETMAVTVANIVTADIGVRKKFYETMRDFVAERAKECKQQADMILAAMDMPEEEKEELIKRVKKMIEDQKNPKIEN